MPWWIDTSAGSDWTIEEQKTRRAIALIAIVAFLPVFMIEMWLLDRFGVDRNLGALIDVASSAFFAFWAAHRICRWCWPDMVKRADANAAKRLTWRQSDP
jgi:hypothetical protein